MSVREAQTQTPYPKKIKIRKIKHDQINKASINKNCPKFIIGHCWLTFRQKILSSCPPQLKYQVEASFGMVEGWIRQTDKDKLTLDNLKTLFGTTSDGDESIRRHAASKVFFSFLRKNLLSIVMENKKVQKVLSYLICLEKFTSRLGHPDLLNKLQFK